MNLDQLNDRDHLPGVVHATTEAGHERMSQKIVTYVAEIMREDVGAKPDAPVCTACASNVLFYAIQTLVKNEGLDRESAATIFDSVGRDFKAAALNARTGIPAPLAQLLADGDYTVETFSVSTEGQDDMGDSEETFDKPSKVHSAKDVGAALGALFGSKPKQA